MITPRQSDITDGFYLKRIDRIAYYTELAEVAMKELYDLRNTWFVLGRKRQHEILVWRVWYANQATGRAMYN